MIDKDFLDKIPLPSRWKIEIIEDSLYLHTGEGLPFTLDFSKIKNLTKNQPLTKAIGATGDKKLRVLDLTAGWGKDAFLLACLSCDVVAIESHPLVFTFLQSALAKENLKSPKSLQFILDNSLNYLKNMKSKEKPEVIYIDPMFASSKKSLSTKPLRILQELVGESDEVEALFEASLDKALHRIVVKRHRLQKPLSTKSLRSTFSGRSVCYDVFSPQIKKEQV